MNTLLIVVAVVASACGGSPIKPTPPPPPPQPAQIAGQWSGTLEASNYQPLAVFVSLNQSAATVTGTWSAQAGSSGIAGNITGTTDPGSFTGTITFSINQSSGCSGSFSGPATTNATTLSWTGAGFTGNCQLTGGNPLSPRFVLQRR